MNTSIPIVPRHKLGQAMVHMVEQGKRPCFHINNLRITMASSASANPGSLYIKTNDWDYIGKINTEGYISIRYPSKITDEQYRIVQAAVTDPEGTAMSHGKEIGTCCCCGRKLTNKLSIELGIGPICRGFWFPDSIAIEPIETTTMREMIGTLEATDGLELGLGMDSIAIVSKPTVEELVIIYKSLDANQKNVFLKLIEMELN